MQTFAVNWDVWKNAAYFNMVMWDWTKYSGWNLNTEFFFKHAADDNFAAYLLWFCTLWHNLTEMVCNVFFRKNPNQVDTRTVRVLMEVAELHRRHLGGQLLFSPDGLLHIILGDGMITLDDMEEMDGLRWDQRSKNCSQHDDILVCASWLNPLLARTILKVYFLCVCWMQWFHRVSLEGWCGYGHLHVTLFHTPEQSILQQHQPATWNLCSWITWSRQASGAWDT